MNRKKLVAFLYRTWLQWRLTIFIIIFVIVPLKSSIADWNWVPTGSMKPTIIEGDMVYVNKLAYGLRLPLTSYRITTWSQPQRGDIVILFSPEDGTRLVKRVVGLPGDKIRIQDNILVINGQPLHYVYIEPDYLKDFTLADKKSRAFAMEKLGRTSHAVMSTPSIKALRNYGPVTVPQGYYFVLGDNRDSSRDSRFFGFVPREAIIGKALAVVVSFDLDDYLKPRFHRFINLLK